MTLKNIFEPEFEKWFERLPLPLRKKAMKALKNLEECDPSDFSRGLNLKKIKGYETLYSIRIDNNYRAIGDKRGDTVYWEWVGPHDEYMRRLKG